LSESPEHPSEDSGDDPTTVRTATGSGPAAIQSTGSDGFNPYAKMFGPEGKLDTEYVNRRIPTLVELLRRHPGCFPIRLEHDDLGQRLLAEDAADLREATEEAAFETALAAFSRAYLHEFVDEGLRKDTEALLRAMTTQTDLTRRQRVAAAIGLTLLSGVPDDRGPSGRGVFDLVFRVTLEELHAQERIRKLSSETKGGLPAKDLEKFWAEYPALRFRFEQRYRREVTRVVQAIEERNFPMAISLDLALRGTAALTQEVRSAREDSNSVESSRVHDLLRDPFQSDLLDGGRDLVLARWATAAQNVRGASDDRRAYERTVETAIRIVTSGGPGSDVILFAAYLHAIADGRFHVDDPDEAEAARPIFGDEGLSLDGALGYADFHAKKGNTEVAHRITLAALEVWPDDETVRARAEAMGSQELDDARDVRQGPTYLEDDEDAEVDGAES